MSGGRVLSSILCAALAVTAAARDDSGWPGLWGPSGDGRAGSEARLPRGDTLRAQVAWRRPIGSGVSGIALVEGRGFTAQQDGESDYVFAFDAKTGREQWRVKLSEAYRGHDGAKDGPASTPAVAAGRVFVVGRTGTLFALDAGTGKTVWQHDLKAEYQAPAPFYGFATSPLVVDGRVFVQVGGERNNLMAFDAASGAVAWAVTHSKSTGYASPILATLLGVRQLIVIANDTFYGVRLEDGGLLWRQPTGWSGEVLRAPLVLPGDRVLVSGPPEAKLFQLRREGERVVVEELWKTPRLKNTLSPTVFIDGRLYGYSSQYLVCLDAASARARLAREDLRGILDPGRRALRAARSRVRRAARGPALGRGLSRAAQADGLQRGRLVGDRPRLPRRARIHAQRRGDGRRGHPAMKAPGTRGPFTPRRSAAGVPAASVVLSLSLVAFVAPRACAQARTESWPQWLGPTQNGTAVDPGRFAGKDAVRLEKLWSRPLETGHAALAVGGGRVFTLFSDGSDEYAVALQAETGAEAWKVKLEPDLERTFLARADDDPGAGG